MNDFQPYFTLLQEHISFYQDFLSFEEKKLDVILSNSVHQLDQIVKNEQVFVLKGRNLEQQRIKLHEQMGFHNFTFDEVILHATDVSTKEQLRQLKTTLHQLVQQIQSINQLCQEQTQYRLEDIGHAINGVPVSQQNKSLHNNNNILNKTI